MKIPTALEINPIPECYDGIDAVTHFEGKSVEQAAKLFEDNGLYYSDDLRWMGPIGFMYYFKAAHTYMKSDTSQGDNSFLSSMIRILEFRIIGEHNDYIEIMGGKNDYVDFCRYALDNYDEYDLDEVCFGDLRPNLRRLLEILKG